ncbi:helix-turn-helix transcriptional regulator [Nocardia sp. NPDC059246]|uniref:helix-turn-helix transcriptional regulator n=1 Tax=unclassified Nocardia TaxID=2637762 RepID=UPI003685906A
MQVRDGKQIRRWRMQRRYSQRELAFLVQRSQSTIHLIETGKLRQISEDLAVAIASRLDVPWADLFDAHEIEPVSAVAHGA